jgi:hypothetical protein
VAAENGGGISSGEVRAAILCVLCAAGGLVIPSEIAADTAFAAAWMFALYLALLDFPPLRNAGPTSQRIYCMISTALIVPSLWIADAKLEAVREESEAKLISSVLAQVLPTALRPPPTAAATQTARPAPADCSARTTGQAPHSFGGIGFGEQAPKTVTLLFGGNVATQTAARLRKDRLTPIGVPIPGAAPLTEYMIGNRFYVDAHVVNPETGSTITVEQNQVRVEETEAGALDAAVDFNYSQNALEVVDSQVRPIFQMIRRRRDTVEVYRIFQLAPGRYGIMDANGTELGSAPRDLTVKRIFAYPSWKYLGCFAAVEGTGQPCVSLRHRQNVAHGLRELLQRRVV